VRRTRGRVGARMRKRGGGYRSSLKKGDAGQVIGKKGRFLRKGPGTWICGIRGGAQSYTSRKENPSAGFQGEDREKSSTERRGRGGSGPTEL